MCLNLCMKKHHYTSTLGIIKYLCTARCTCKISHASFDFGSVLQQLSDHIFSSEPGLTVSQPPIAKRTLPIRMRTHSCVAITPRTRASMMDLVCTQAHSICLFSAHTRGDSAAVGFSLGVRRTVPPMDIVITGRHSWSLYSFAVCVCGWQQTCLHTRSGRKPPSPSTVACKITSVVLFFCVEYVCVCNNM